MRIGIDIRALAGPRAGIHNYVLFLARALLSEPQGHRYGLYGPWVRSDPLPQLPKELHIRFRWWRSLGLEYAALCGRPPWAPPGYDVYHMPHPACVPAIPRGACLVVTIHDLAFLHRPDLVMDRGFFRFLVHAVSEQVASADRVVADSCSTADDIARAFGMPRERVTVIYPGYDAEVYGTDGDDEPGSVPTWVPKRFILSVGTIEPRKNHVTLIEAFEQFVAATGLRDVHLLLAGCLGWKYEAVLARIEASSCRPLIRHASDLPNKVLAGLYRRAICLAYPSLYEGFGLPILEAMACGCPVVTSRRSSMPEVAGDAGILVEPTDRDELTHALCRVVEDEALRRRMRDAGLQRAPFFSWQAAARAMVAVYENRRPDPWPAPVSVCGASAVA